jgi:BlaI family penicillinase repressor
LTATPKLPEPTPRELEILKVLWEQGPSSVRVVHRVLQMEEPTLAYTTVQTMLRLMEGKGLVAHAEEGRTFVYTARFTRDHSAVRFLDRVFGGAAALMVQSLLRSERISEEELERLQTLIAEARQRKDEG